MKVTVTERGTEYLREFYFDQVNDSTNRTKSVPKLRLQSQTANVNTRKELATLLQMKSSKNIQLSNRKMDAHLLATELLDSLVPAMMASNPPNKIAIKMPRVYVSSKFREKYIREPVQTPNTPLFPNLTGTKNTINDNSKLNITNGLYTTREYYQVNKDEENKLCKTLYRFSKEKTPQRLRQVKDIAATLMAKSWKRSKLKLIKKEEKDPQTLIKRAVTKRMERNDEIINADVAKIMHKIQPLVNEKIEHGTIKERYKERLQLKHSKIVDEWFRFTRIQQLSKPFKRKISVPMLKTQAF